MPLTSRPVLRRTTLAAAPLAALVGGLAGCRWGPADDAAPEPAGSTGPAPADDDTEVAATALAATNRVADLVTRVAARHPGLAGPLADVTLMHQAHADLLAEAGEASEEAAPQPVPGRSAGRAGAGADRGAEAPGDAGRGRRRRGQRHLRPGPGLDVRGGRAAAHPAGRHRRGSDAMSAVDTDEVEALQTALAGEHAALWVYGVLGGQTSRSATPSLFREVTAGYQAHRGRRDQLVRSHP